MNCTNVYVSESVSVGHPDIVADYISDCILDEYIKNDVNTRAGIETMVKDNIVVVGGEINSKAIVDVTNVVKNAFNIIKYPSNHKLAPNDIKVVNLIGVQSNEIHSGVDKDVIHIGAGDQGWMSGYASNETPTYMPLACYISKTICKYFDCDYTYGPDAKSQVVVEGQGEDAIVKSILVSTMHQNGVDEAREYVLNAIMNNDIGLDNDIFEKHIKNNKDLEITVNPCGSWHIGGSVSDCGMTGRKIVVGAYGSYCNVGGGARSGKDCTKVDRSGSYMCRYLAKNIVASGLANECKVELSYKIGVETPMSINICIDTECVDVDKIKEYIVSNINLTPYGMIERFYNAYGHFRFVTRHGAFGWSDEEQRSLFGFSFFPWEKTDFAEKLAEWYKMN